MTIKPLSLLVRRVRRLTYALIAWYALAIAGSVLVTMLVPERRWQWFWISVVVIVVVIGPLVAAGFIKATRRDQDRAAELQVAEGRWRAPLTTRQSSHGPMHAVGFYMLLTAFGPGHLWADDQALTILFLAFWFAGLAVTIAVDVWAARRGNCELRLTPEGVHLPQLFGSALVPWSEIHLRGISYSPRRPTSVTVRHGLHNTEESVISNIVDPRFLATVICFYTEYPHERALIGTDTGYARLLQALAMQRQPVSTT
jgi:MFS family permease